MKISMSLLASGLFLVEACASPTNTGSTVKDDTAGATAAAEYDCEGTDVALYVDSASKIEIQNSECGVTMKLQSSDGQNAQFVGVPASDSDVDLCGSGATISAGALSGQASVSLALAGGESSGNYTCKLQSANAPGAADAGEAGHFSPSNPPSQCLGSATAFKINVLSAMLADHVTDAKLSDIKQTGFDNHDPEYDVTVGGKSYHVSCDDSGDDDCQCSVD